jgi:N-acetylglucosaminyldiphosphoundecaprenol N-acetyl-beta-D-mannosaminyltransferase
MVAASGFYPLEPVTYERFYGRGRATFCIGQKGLNDMAANPKSWPARELFGIPIDAITMDQAIQIIADTICSRARLQIGVVNAAKILNMRSDELLEKDVLSSGLILADGMSVVWASRLLRCPLPERVAGIDLMMRMLEVGNERSWRVYCLGATDEVLSRVTARMASDYPNLQVAGARNGYFTDVDEERIASQIAAARPDILLIAMTSPKKERFLARWSAKLGVPVCHGVGGSFDVYAGKVKRAPLSWQRLGLEWFFRFAQEPGRLWKRYLVTNTKFCALLMSELVGQLFRRRVRVEASPGR